MKELCHPHDIAEMDLGELFEKLDTDGSGGVSVEEFHNAIRHCAEFSSTSSQTAAKTEGS